MYLKSQQVLQIRDVSGSGSNLKAAKQDIELRLLCQAANVEGTLDGVKRKEFRAAVSLSSRRAGLMGSVGIFV